MHAHRATRSSSSPPLLLLRLPLLLLPLLLLLGLLGLLLPAVEERGAGQVQVVRYSRILASTRGGGSGLQQGWRRLRLLHPLLPR